MSRFLPLRFCCGSGIIVNQMSPLVAFTIAAWVWIGLAAIAVIISTIVVFVALADEEWPVAIAALLALLASSGFLFTSLHTAGYSSPAYWVWRITGGFTVILGIACAVKSLTDFSADVWEKIIVLGVTIFSVLPLVCSIPATSQGTLPKPLQGGFSERILIVSEITLWHNVALIMVGTGTVMFLVLFVRAVSRGIAPGVESHWGGLGGGLSGWQISLSLTYFIGSVIFGGLFSLLALRGDTAVTDHGTKASAAGETTSVVQQKAVLPAVVAPATSAAQAGPAADSETSGK
jgi:hypothetical protein